MTWYYIPLSACAPESEDWNAGSAKHWAELFASSVTWKGKPLPARSWSRILPKVNWMMRRYGRTLSPSTLASGAEKWIASLPATPASRSASPAAEAGHQTPAISGPTLPASSTSQNPGGASSKTSRTTSTSATTTLSNRSSKAAASALQREYSQRLKSALLTSGGGFSSLPKREELWATPAARDWRPPNTLRHMTTRSRPHMDQLPNQVVYGPLGRWLLESGLIPSANGPGSLRLNPLFVEWLMGFPLGSTIVL